MQVISQEFSQKPEIQEGRKTLVEPFYLYESAPRYGAGFDLLVSVIESRFFLF